MRDCAHRLLTWLFACVFRIFDICFYCARPQAHTCIGVASASAVKAEPRNANLSYLCLCHARTTPTHASASAVKADTRRSPGTLT